MLVIIAYIAVVIIWSTTPLGIVWSSESVHPTMAVLLRMIIAIIPGFFILKVAKIEFPWHSDARKVYMFSSIGIFGGMIFSYLAAQYIASGLMSLIFGLAPIISGLLAQKILGEPTFSKIKTSALFIAFIGLSIVCLDSIALTGDSIIGVIAVLIGMFCFSISGVLVKSINIRMHALATTVGALTYSIPLFFIMWIIFDGNLSYEQWNSRSVIAILYLGVFGSFVGFIAYYYILQKLNASTVALITMMTPVFALSLGAMLNNEPITSNLIVGASCVVVGLALYQWGGRRRTRVSVTS